ncbi:ferrous iron transport protein A [Nodosilinea sp. PGN35]|uniref:FeoA family protein n=1 Tax=Nodosilinea sp. PGN35 TaxID=3020489 RepID=UPI0023B22F74|nr:ferrous iron transport protein A [Nodosilinea sp. TSF1-S3]MDF0367084.1 ferrous iron transport protein A [Nodosilinea sp. TSF1-S3]
MEHNFLSTAPSAALEAEVLDITFVGGTADLGDAPASGGDWGATDGVAPGAAVSASLPLTMAAIGDRVWVVSIQGGRRLVRRLMDVGIVQGCEIAVVSRTESGSVIVGLQGCRIGLGSGMAHRVLVTTAQMTAVQVATSQLTEAQAMTQPAPAQPVTADGVIPASLHLGALAVGQSGRIVGYENAHRAYREKLLPMGLTPGTYFTVTRQAPMGDPIEIEVRGYKLSLRKGEAAALKVEGV